MAAVIILSGNTLNPNLIWREQYAFAHVAQETTRTLAGNMVTFSAGLVHGRPITLEATAERGWFLKSEVDTLIALAEVVGAVYSLTVGSESFSVQFRHQDLPAFEFTAFVPRIEHVAGDYFTGSIKLETVA